MKRTVMAAMVASLLVGSVALADPPHDYHHDQHDQHHEDHHADMHHRDMHHGDMRHGDMHHGDMHHGNMHHGNMHRGAHFNTGHYARPRGWHAHSWRRGERLPSAYRASAYVIPNATVYHLRPPPAGYYWVRVDNNAVLAAVATGVVLDVAVNLFH